MSYLQNNSCYVSILGRRHGREENLYNVSCGIFDMSAYVDALRRCLVSPDIDYLIIEPYKVGDIKFGENDFLTLQESIF